MAVRCSYLTGRVESCHCVCLNRPLFNFLYSSFFKQSPPASADGEAETQSSLETPEQATSLQELSTGSCLYLSLADLEAQTAEDKMGSASLTVVKLSILLK